jgi:hypothetical protein
LHHIPGRIRLRIPAAKGQAATLQQVRDALMPLEAVRRVSTNETIGTIVIDYNPALHRQFVRDLARTERLNELLSVRDGAANQLHTTESLADHSIDRAVDKVNRGVQRATAGAINLKELLPFSILFYAVFFVDKALAAAQWLSWIQFAFSSYVELHQEEPVAKINASVEALRADVAAMHEETMRAIEVLSAHAKS